MSSFSEGLASVAPILIMPAAAIGLLAWKSGEAVYNLNRRLDEGIEAVKQQAAERNQQRREEALELREKLMNRIRGMFSELDTLCLRAGPEAAVELNGLKQELTELLNSSCPEETEELQAHNSAVYLSIEKILRRQKLLAQSMETKADSYTDIICMSRLMDELRSYFACCSFSAVTVTGASVDPEKYETARLRASLAETCSRLSLAMDHISRLSQAEVLSSSWNSWLQSCFNGAEELLDELQSSSCPRAQLKGGISALKDMIEQYCSLLPDLDRDCLYSHYTRLCYELAEDPKKLRAFSSREDLEQETKRLEKRRELALERAQLCRNLGRSAYICYAWEQVLSRSGYRLYSRRGIEEKMGCVPEGSDELPFYSWGRDEITQLYSLSESCSMQLIVGPEGEVSLKTISHGDTPELVRRQQKSHCAALMELRRILKEQWFIDYENNEVLDYEQLNPCFQWLSDRNNKWSGTLTDTRRLQLLELERRARVGNENRRSVN